MLDTFKLAVGVKKDETRLLEEVNKWISANLKNGKLDAIYKKWFEPGPTKINYPMSDRLRENFQLIALPD